MSAVHLRTSANGETARAERKSPATQHSECVLTANELNQFDTEWSMIFMDAEPYCNHRFCAKILLKERQLEQIIRQRRHDRGVKSRVIALNVITRQNNQALSPHLGNVRINHINP